MELVKADTPVTPHVIPFKDKTVRGKLWTLLPWVVFGVACVLLVVGLIVHYADGLDDDMASELILAKMLSEGKGFILTNQWFYSTEIRFLNTQLIFTPLFWIFKSWAVVRIVGTIILNGILLLSFYFLLASLQRKDLFPWLAALLLLPVSYRQVMLINFGAYYIPHIAIAFTVIGLTFYAVRAVSRRNFWLLVGGGSVLSLLAGMGGFRTVVLLNLPLFMAAVIYWWLKRHNAVNNVATKLLISSAVVLAAALVGLLINVVILQNCFSFTNWATGLSWRNWTITSLQDVFIAVFTTLGWHEGKIFSVTTLGNVVAVMILLLLIVAVVDIIKHRERYNDGIVTVTLFTLSGLVVLTGLVLATTLNLDMRFTFPITFFILPIIVAYLSENWQWQIITKKLKTYLKPVFGVVAIGLILVNGVVISSQFYFANQYPWHNVSRNTSLITVANQLLAEECTQGYYLGRTENEAGGNVLTELTDGKIAVWHLRNSAENLDDIDHWLQPVSHATTRPTGKVFVLIDRQQVHQQPLAQKIIATTDNNCLHTDDEFVVYVYNSVDDLIEIIKATTTDVPAVATAEKANE